MFNVSNDVVMVNKRLQCPRRHAKGIRPNSIRLICCGYVADFVVQLVVQRIHNESNKWSLACSLPHSNLGYLSRLFDGVMKTGTRVAVCRRRRAGAPYVLPKREIVVGSSECSASVHFSQRSAAVRRTMSRLVPRCIRAAQTPTCWLVS